jgi:hypothetical protein
MKALFRGNVAAGTWPSLVTAAEAFATGYGGIAAVAMATGVAPSTIGVGLKELAWRKSDSNPPRDRLPTLEAPHTHGESRAFAPVAMEGTAESDSPAEERGFEP